MTFIICHLVFIPPAHAQSLKIHFLDVGYGDATLIEFSDNSTILIDAGEDPYGAQLMVSLQDRGITHIDTAIITHSHKNHFEGFHYVLEEIPIGRVFINAETQVDKGYFYLLERFRQADTPIAMLWEGDEINGLPDGIAIKVLHPAEMNGTPNGNSLVTWLTYEDFAIVMMADIEEDEQDMLIERYTAQFKDVKAVKAPHHGGPLSERFMKIFDDVPLIISTGENEWGIPDEDQLDQLDNDIFRTDRDGTIVLETDGKTFTISTQN